MVLVYGCNPFFEIIVAHQHTFPQNHRSSERNKNGLQPCTKTIDPENTIKMDNSHVPKQSIKRTQ
jgi:hypothetical protein